jgi:hypothetical protein
VAFSSRAFKFTVEQLQEESQQEDYHLQNPRQQLEGGGKVSHFFQAQDQQSKGQVAIISKIRG